MTENRKTSHEANPWARVQSTLDDHSLALMSTANALKQASDEIGKCNQHLENLGARTNDLAARVETVVKTAATKASEVATDELVKQLNTKLASILAEHLKSADRRVLDAWSKELSAKLVALDRESEEVRKRLAAHEKQYEEATKRLSSIQTRMNEAAVSVRLAAATADHTRRRSEDLDEKAKKMADRLALPGSPPNRRTSPTAAADLSRTENITFVVREGASFGRRWLAGALFGRAVIYDDEHRRYAMEDMSPFRRRFLRVLHPRIAAMLVGGTVETRMMRAPHPRERGERTRQAPTASSQPDTFAASFNDDDIPF